MEVVSPQNCKKYLDKLQLNYSVSVKPEKKKKKMILILIVSEKAIVELTVEEGTMKFAGRKVGTVESSKREHFSFSCIHIIAFGLGICSHYGLPNFCRFFTSIIHFKIRGSGSETLMNISRKYI